MKLPSLAPLKAMLCRCAWLACSSASTLLLRADGLEPRAEMDMLGARREGLVLGVTALPLPEKDAPVACLD